MSNRLIEYVVRAKDEASGKFGTLADKIGVSKGALLGMAAAAAAVAAAVVVALKKMISVASDTAQEMADLGDSLDKMALRTNINASTLAEWGFVLERAGGQQADLETAVRRMSKSMNDYQRGLSTAVDAWDALGVSATDSSGQLKDVNEILFEMADALPKITNDAERMAIAQEVLGRGGLKMAAMFKDGAGPIKDQIALFHRLNGTMTGEFTAGAAAVIDAQTDLKAAINGMKADLMTPIQPILAETIDEMALVVADFGKWIEANEDEVRRFGEDLGAIALAAVKMTGAIGKFTTEHGEEFIRILAAADPLLSAFVANLDLMRKFAAEGDVAIRESTISIEEMTAGFADALANQVPRGELGAAAVEAADVIRGKIIGEAEDMGVELFVTAFDPNTGEWGRVDKTMAELSKEITARLAANLQLDMGNIDSPTKDFTFAEPEGLELWAREAEEFQASLGDIAETLMEVKLRPWPDEDTLEAMEEYRERTEAVDNAVLDVARNFERLASNSISAMFKANSGAIMFGRTLRTVVLDALSAVIAKLLVIAAIKAFTKIDIGGVKEGGRLAFGGGVTPMAAGGSGYAITGGRPGMDSRLFMGMEGEEVINRHLSHRLDRYLSAQETSAAVSPFASFGGGGRGDIHLHMDLARPVGTIDSVGLGEDLLAAAEFIREAEL